MNSLIKWENLGLDSKLTLNFGYLDVLIGKRACYLDLIVSFENYFLLRDDFSFKVMNFPCKKYSNILIVISSMIKLTLEFIDKSFDKLNLLKIYLKFIENYEKEWCIIYTLSRTV